MEKEKKKLSKSQKIMIIINSVAVLLIIGIILFFCIYYKDTLKLLASEEGKKEFVEKLENTGFWGVLLLIAIQILQVIVAFIPGEVVELAAGAMFGPIWGTILCLIGLNLATIIIYYLVKALGKPFFNLNVKEKQASKMDFLKDPDRSIILLFFLFLIPGIPKDIFIYFIPFTKIKLSKFILISSIARIPSILSSTFVGAAIFDENFIGASIVMGIIFVGSVLGLIFNKKIYEAVNRYKRNHLKKKVDENHESK